MCKEGEFLHYTIVCNHIICYARTAGPPQMNGKVVDPQVELPLQLGGSRVFWAHGRRRRKHAWKMATFLASLKQNRKNR